MAYRVKAAGLGLDAIITVVDAANFDRHEHEAQVARTQVEAADFLVLNKLDLVDQVAATRLERRLAKLNGRAERLGSIRGAVDSELLFATGVATYRARARATSDHVHEDGIDSLLLTSTRPLDQDAFDRFLRRLPRDILRAKGIVHFAGRDWQGLFNFTCGRSELTWIKSPGPVESQAVFIGRAIQKMEAQLRRELRACETDDERSADHG